SLTGQYPQPRSTSAGSHNVALHEKRTSVPPNSALAKLSNHVISPGALSPNGSVSAHATPASVPRGLHPSSSPIPRGSQPSSSFSASSSSSYTCGAPSSSGANHHCQARVHSADTLCIISPHPHKAPHAVANGKPASKPPVSPEANRQAAQRQAT